MPSDLLAAREARSVPRSRRSLRSTGHCEPMWRNDWQASSSIRVELLFPARLCDGMAAGMDHGSIGGGQTPGAGGVVQQCPDPCRMPARPARQSAHHRCRASCATEGALRAFFDVIDRIGAGCLHTTLDEPLSHRRMALRCLKQRHSWQSRARDATARRDDICGGVRDHAQSHGRFPVLQSRDGALGSTILTECGLLATTTKWTNQGRSSLH